MSEDRRTALRAALGPVGVWSFALQANGAADARAAISALDAMGYGATWFPESLGSKEAFAHAAILLGAGGRMIVATGVANIHARDPMAMANGARTLSEAYPDRFVLGIGVSHAPSVATRGGMYGKPIATMTAYLDAMADAAYAGPPPLEPAPLILAALGPRMLELAAARSDGAHSYFVPVEHTSFARGVLGPGAFLAVEQAAVLDIDPARARGIAREFAGRYLRLANYANNLRRLGWADDDLVAGGSDRLLDAVIVQGGAASIAERVREHLDAGADHVCLQLRSSNPADLCLDAYAAVRSELDPLFEPAAS